MRAFFAALSVAILLANPADGASSACGKIISMAPSVTETLYSLGLGENVVGVTPFCERPKEATTKAKVGGYFDVNYEAVIALRPTLVIVHEGRGDQEARLTRLGVKTLAVDQSSVSGIIGSIEKIGELCGVENNTATLLSGLRGRMEAVRSKIGGAVKPRVLVAVGRNIGAASVMNVYIAGKGSYYDDIIRLAGGVNAYDGTAVATPMVSAEGIISLKPDYVIELIPPLNGKVPDTATAEKDWTALSSFGKGFKARVITGSHTVVPGPAFTLLLEDMARLIHPEIAW